jgi:acyl carrier protein
MQLQELRPILKEIFREVSPEIPFEKIDSTKPLREQVEIDSYDLYRIIVRISERTGVNIPDSVLGDLKNLDQLLKYVSGTHQLKQ